MHVTDLSLVQGKSISNVSLKVEFPQADPVAQWVTSVIADPRVVSSIPVQPHTFVEIDHEIFSSHHVSLKKLPSQMVILVQINTHAYIRKSKI